MNQFVKNSTLLILSAVFSISFAELLTFTDLHTSQVKRDEGDESYGLVYGAKSCGGPGKFVHLHVEGCTTADSICQLPANNQTLHGVLEFIPSANIQQLGLRYLLSEDGIEFKEIINKKIPSPPVVAGVEAKISGTCQVDPKLKGKLVTTLRYLYNADNGADELCYESQYQFV